MNCPCRRDAPRRRSRSSADAASLRPAYSRLNAVRTPRRQNAARRRHSSRTRRPTVPGLSRKSPNSRQCRQRRRGTGLVTSMRRSRVLSSSAPFQPVTAVTSPNLRCQSDSRCLTAARSIPGGRSSLRECQARSMRVPCPAGTGASA